MQNRRARNQESAACKCPTTTTLAAAGWQLALILCKHTHCNFGPELATMRTPSYIHTTYKQDAREDDVSDEVGDDEEELDEGGWN